MTPGAPADLWKNTLSRIPTLFGKLAYLASLRNPNTGKYEHFGLAQRFSEEEADATLTRSHLDTFDSWLALGLRQQHADLLAYMEDSDGELREVISNWVKVPPYPAYLPAGSRQVERELYLSDLRTVLEVLRGEYGVAAPDPDA